MSSLRELLETERSYLHSLNAVMSFYHDRFPLQDEKDVVFLNIGTIRELHVNMLDGFEAAAGSPSLIAAVFAHQGAFLRLYIEYW
jgi:hypothetical protein